MLPHEGNEHYFYTQNDYKQGTEELYKNMECDLSF